MKLTSLFLTAAAFAAAPVVSARADIDRVVEKTLAGHPGGTLTVSTQGGGVQVEISSDGSVKVTAHEHIDAGTEAEADALVAKLTLTIEPQGDGVSVISHYEDRPMDFHWGSWPPVRVDFVVAVPARYNVDLKTSGGSIQVGDLDGTAHLRTAGGSIRLGRISGEIDGSTSGGSIRLEEGRAKVRLATSGGSIFAGHLGGPADLRTSGGSIHVDAADAALSARTSGGSVTAAFVGPLKGDSLLSTSGGRVSVIVEAGSGFDLDASASGGGIDAEGLNITLENYRAQSGRLAGKVGAGGPVLKLRASGGGIKIETRAADQK